MKKYFLLSALFLFLLAACTAAGGTETSKPSEDSAHAIESSAAAPSVETPEIETPEPTSDHQEVIVTEESTLPIGAETLIELAIHDLARRLGVEISAITLISFEAVIWPDTSLGCPKPGMAYLQVLQDGVRIQLSYEDTTYNYHGGGGRDPFLCVQTPPQKDTDPQLDLGDFITPSPSTDS